MSKPNIKNKNSEIENFWLKDWKSEKKSGLGPLMHIVHISFNY